jgi:hypothetical protein
MCPDDPGEGKPFAIGLSPAVSLGRPGRPVRLARRGPLAGSAVVAILVAGAISLGPGPAFGQETHPPNRGGFTTSMGLPPTWRWTAGFTGRTYRRAGGAQVGYLGSLGVYRDIMNPMTSALGVIGEGYLGQRGTFEGFIGGLDGGGRLGLFSPAARLAVGADYNVPDEELDLFISFVHPLRRGGFFVGGGCAWFDYVPGRNHSAGIGIRLPIGQKFVGHTRARRNRVKLSDRKSPSTPHRPDTGAVAALDHARDLAHWINRLTVPFTDHWNRNPDKAMDRFVEAMGELKAHLAAAGGGPAAGRRTPVHDVEAYHREVERAFSIAVSGRSANPGESTALGVRVADKAREVILDQVLLPYNRLLGQRKKNDSTRGFGSAAASEFYEWLAREAKLTDQSLRATEWTFASLLEIVERERAYNARQWGDSRFVWLPFQLALKPWQHDEQAEIDALVERATEERFTRGNKHWYVDNEQFQAELMRTLLETEDYHVLWIHDFRGYDEKGAPDEMAFKQVVDGYLRALINRVKRYDSDGKIPQYFVFIDQMYFQANGGKLWLDLLQDPLHHRIDLPESHRAWADSIDRIQQELRAAVAASQLMQAQAPLFERGWIENLVKVHVNVTNPADPSFWSWEVLPFPIGLPDAAMRDHRKIAFYDVSEADPYRGMALYTGTGVGEHYIGAGWEDRGMMVQGPIALSLKGSARQLLLNQGFTEAEIPWELRPRARHPDYDRMVADSIRSLGDWGSDMQLHNQTGFAFKPVSVVKATLYTLMPPGSVIKAPDSIWGSHFWGAMMLGNALRGGRSLVMAPAIDNAPSSGFPQLSRAQENLTRLVVAGRVLRDEIEGQGGLLKVGLYASHLSVGNIPGKMQALLDNLDATPWLKQLYGFHPRVLAQIKGDAAALVQGGFDRPYQVSQKFETPMLHMKAHYFATREAWDGLLARPDIGPVLLAYFREMALQNQALARGEYRHYRHFTESVLPHAHPVIDDYMRQLPPPDRARVAQFFTIGSHNQNNRSFALDGEVALVVSGWSAVFGLPDFFVIAGLCHWVEDVEDLEKLFPRYKGLQRKISRKIRIAV